jgi:hypothetical protein
VPATGQTYAARIVGVDLAADIARPRDQAGNPGHRRCAVPQATLGLVWLLLGVLTRVGMLLATMAPLRAVQRLSGQNPLLQGVSGHSKTPAMRCITGVCWVVATSCVGE